MFTYLLGIQKLQNLLRFRPVFRVLFHQARQGDVVISISWFLTVIPFAAVLKINPYQIDCLNEIARQSNRTDRRTFEYAD